MEEHKRKERVLHRLLTVNPEKSFLAGGRTKLLEKRPPPLCEGDPFMDAWANPVLRRGVPKDQQELLDSTFSRKSLFLKAPARPYYTATSGNKSTVHPNGLFDIILDAERTGGSAQRHLGATERFGVPDNSDYRPPNGPIPEPPVRSTTLFPSK